MKMHLSVLLLTSDDLCWSTFNHCPFAGSGLNNRQMSSRLTLEYSGTQRVRVHFNDHKVPKSCGCKTTTNPQPSIQDCGYEAFLLKCCVRFITNMFRSGQSDRTPPLWSHLFISIVPEAMWFLWNLFWTNHTDVVRDFRLSSVSSLKPDVYQLLTK